MQCTIALLILLTWCSSNTFSHSDIVEEKVSDYRKYGMLAKDIMEEIMKTRLPLEADREALLKLDPYAYELIVAQMEHRPTLAIHVDKYERVTVAGNIFSRRHKPYNSKLPYIDELFYLDEYDRDIIARKLRGDEYFKDKEITIIIPKVRPTNSFEAHNDHAEMQLLKNRREQIKLSFGEGRKLSRDSAIGISKTACQNCCEKLELESEKLKRKVTFYFNESQARWMKKDQWTRPEDIGDLERIAVPTKAKLENKPPLIRPQVAIGPQAVVRPKCKSIYESVNMADEALERRKRRFPPTGSPPQLSVENNDPSNDKLSVASLGKRESAMRPEDVERRKKRFSLHSNAFDDPNAKRVKRHSIACPVVSNSDKVTEESPANVPATSGDSKNTPPSTSEGKPKSIINLKSKSETGRRVVPDYLDTRR